MKSLFTPALLALFMGTTSAMAFDIDKMSDAERATFRTEIGAYLMDNPQIIMDAVAVLQQREAQAAAQDDMSLVATHADAIFDDGYSWVGGNLEGDITLVEFVDYRCGYCRKASSDVEELIKSDGNIRIIMKEFPILGEASTQSARFAIAVKQILGADTYKLTHDALISMRADVNETSLKRLAKGLGFDAAPILAHMESDEVSSEIAQTNALAQKLRITGTPTFVMQDELLRGYVPLDGMQQIVADKRG